MGCAPSWGADFRYPAPNSYWPTPVQAPTGTAKIFVTLPADAKLTFDGNPTTSTSDSRVFQSPGLPPGKTFYYTLEATVVRGGKTQAVTKKVAVRAGEDTRVDFEIPEATAAE
jgi:uncharacterized protein (TIGR03000 family)